MAEQPFEDLDQVREDIALRRLLAYQVREHEGSGQNDVKMHAKAEAMLFQ